MGITDYLLMKLMKLTMSINEHFMKKSIITFSDIAQNTGKCCICGQKVYDANTQDGHLSLIQIFKRATWNEPKATICINNTGQKHADLAVSMICMVCEGMYGGDVKRLRNDIKYAIELDRHNKKIIYHPVNELQDYPIIIEATSTNRA